MCACFHARAINYIIVVNEEMLLSWIYTSEACFVAAYIIFLGRVLLFTELVENCGLE